MPKRLSVKQKSPNEDAKLAMAKKEAILCPGSVGFEQRRGGWIHSKLEIQEFPVGYKNILKLRRGGDKYCEFLGLDDKMNFV